MSLMKVNVISNPFVDGTNIPDELFCDRKEETRDMIELLENGSKIVLKAPRRIGKSSLITHVLRQREIMEKYNTVYVDLLGTNSADEFLREFQKAFTSRKFTRPGTAREILRNVPGNVTLGMERNDFTGTTKATVSLHDLLKVQMSLDTIFEYLEKSDRPCIVVFDEFQQIKYYPEEMTAILRTYIQRTGRTRFIFSGSSGRMLSTMFNSYSEPFYHSAETVELDVISEPRYEEFCQKNFSDYGKSIEKEAVIFAYELAAGNTYEIQRIMRNVFARTGQGKTATADDVRAAVCSILERHDQTYREKLAELNNTKERKVLIAIALEGVATRMLSHEMTDRYELGANSTVAKSLKNLCDEDKLNLVLKAGNAYKLQDKMFELWIAGQYGLLETKFETARQQFEKEKRQEKAMPLPKMPKLTHPSN